MSEVLLKSCEEKMKKAVAALKTDFMGLRTGRATPGMLDTVRVDYYGQKLPVNQVAQIRIADANLILVQAWDAKAIPEIEKAIIKADIGLNPSVDGALIRVPVPQPTQEKRQELAKKAKVICETSKVSIRNMRRDANEDVKKLKKESKMTEDQEKLLLGNVQKLTDKVIAELDQVLAEKEKDVMRI